MCLVIASLVHYSSASSHSGLTARTGKLNARPGPRADCIIRGTARLDITLRLVGHHRVCGADQAGRVCGDRTLILQFGPRPMFHTCFCFLLGGGAQTKIAALTLSLTPLLKQPEPCVPWLPGMDWSSRVSTDQLSGVHGSGCLSNGVRDTKSMTMIGAARPPSCMI